MANTLESFEDWHQKKYKCTFESRLKDRVPTNVVMGDMTDYLTAVARALQAEARQAWASAKPYDPIPSCPPGWEWNVALGGWWPVGSAIGETRSAAADALEGGAPCDADGVFVKVSREAAIEGAKAIRHLENALHATRLIREQQKQDWSKARKAEADLNASAQRCQDVAKALETERATLTKANEFLAGEIARRETVERPLKGRWLP